MAKYLDQNGLLYLWAKIKNLVTSHTSNKNNPHGVTAEQVGALPANPNMVLTEVSQPSGYVEAIGWYRICKFTYRSQLLVFIDNHYRSGGSSNLCLLVQAGGSHHSITILSYSGYNNFRPYQKARLVRLNDTTDYPVEYALDIYYGVTSSNKTLAKCLYESGQNVSDYVSMNWASVPETVASGETVVLTQDLNRTAGGAVLTENDGVKTNSDARLKSVTGIGSATDGGIIYGIPYAGVVDGGLGTRRGSRSITIFNGCNYTDGEKETELGERCYYMPHDSAGYAMFPAALGFNANSGKLYYIRSANGYKVYAENEIIPMQEYEVLHTGNAASLGFGGATVLTGNTIPASSLGANGNFYIKRK